MKAEDIRLAMRNHMKDKFLFEEASQYAYEYMAAVNEKRVYPKDEAIKNLNNFDETFPELPSDASEILKMLHIYGSPAAVAQTGGRYFGFVNGGAVPVSIAAKWLSDVWDQNTALYVMSPIASKLEEICEGWLVNLFGLPEGTCAGFVSGSSTAIFCGLAAARDQLLKRAGWNVSEKGLFGAPNIRVVLGEQAHSSVYKVLSLLGLGNQRVEKVEVDDQGRILLEKLPPLDSKTLVILQAGNVNSGSFDPIDEICSIANEAGAWVHIDGAFGLWAAASSRSHLTKGIEKADSWSVDAHKTLNSPYDCGIILCKNKAALVSTLQASGAYIQYSGNRDGMLYTPEMSRRSRSVELWATLKFLGRQGMKELVDGLCDLTSQLAWKLKACGFRILNDVVYNQILVACDNDVSTSAVLKNIQSSGECWCGGTTWFGRPAIRISICSWATAEADIDRTVRAFVDALELSNKGLCGGTSLQEREGLA